MSAVTGVSNSSSVSYATQLAQTSTFERTLYNLGSAIQNGNLTTAGSILTAFIQANPQYATSSSNSADSQNAINQDFQNLASAISSNQADTARSVWAQLRSDLAQAGVTEISSGTDIAARVVAQNKLSLEQSLLANLFGATSDSSQSVSSLLGATSGPSAGTDSFNAAISNWLTYEASGRASSSATSTSATGSALNLLA